jgi:pimeloyl-ACP methyl ester carboxylesterase
MTDFFTARDGARLAYRVHGTGLPVLALSGLTRTHRDFDYVAPHLPGVQLICPDYRGRGASAFTGEASYTVPQEAEDALGLLDHLGVTQAAVLGTSRGGLIGMYLAATAKPRLLGLALNDVGPVIERTGLEKIFGYVGRNPRAQSYDELAAKLPSLMPGFDNVPEGRWGEDVRRHYHETPEGLKINYDPALRGSFLKAFEGPEIDLWPLFDTCAGLPLALLRGANSDLLSPATVAGMQARHPDMIFAEVPDRAHIPWLDEPESLDVLHRWIGAMA